MTDKPYKATMIIGGEKLVFEADDPDDLGRQILTYYMLERGKTLQSLADAIGPVDPRIPDEPVLA